MPNISDVMEFNEVLSCVVGIGVGIKMNLLFGIHARRIRLPKWHHPNIQKQTIHSQTIISMYYRMCI